MSCTLGFSILVKNTVQQTDSKIAYLAEIFHRKIDLILSFICRLLVSFLQEQHSLYGLIA